MVGRLSLDRPKYAQYQATIERAIEVAEPARTRFLWLADQDAAAYQEFVQARRLSQDTDEQRADREERVRVAARGAADVPMLVVRECHRLVREIDAMAGRSNLNASSDLLTAVVLASAAARGAAANVLVNLPAVGDERYAGMATLEVTEHQNDIESVVARVNQIVLSGNLRSPE
jgi:formiminotetrahydrofolate cyclodeaminase